MLLEVFHPTWKVKSKSKEDSGPHNTVDLKWAVSSVTEEWETEAGRTCEDTHRELVAGSELQAPSPGGNLGKPRS